MLQLPQLNRGVFERLRLAGSADIVNLYAARAARGFGDGFAAIILPAYLLEIGFNPFQIGLVATAALLGSAATTLAVGLLAPRYHLRPRRVGMSCWVAAAWAGPAACRGCSMSTRRAD